MKKKLFTAVSMGVIASSLVLQSAHAADAPVYLISASDGAALTVIATTGDTISGEVLRGIPDGMGALKNADGTLTLLSNHEISTSADIANKKDTGTWASSISKMTFDPTTKKITKIENWMKDMSYYNYTTEKWGSTWEQSLPVGTPEKDSYGAIIGTNGINRLCSGDLVAAGGFSYTEKDAKTKKTVTYGYKDAVYLTGEEGSEDQSRAFAFDANGNGIQLPKLGLAPWENFLTKPGTGKTTIVMGNEDGNATDSQLYMYVGTKQTTGANFAEKAGLTNGKLYTIALENYRTDNAVRAAAKGTKIKVGFNEINTNPKYGKLGAMSQANGTTFSRVEDGEFDSKNPNVYYFVTTESNKDPLATTPRPGATYSRDGGALWKMTFADAKDPFKGATMEMLLNGTEAPYLTKPDNITIDDEYILIQEDPGNNAHIARLVAYRKSDGKIAEIAKFDEQYFITGAAKFMTQDEESSGIINVSKFLKASGDTKSHYFLNAQVHSKLSVARPDLVAGLGTTAVMALDSKAIEGGQYYHLTIDWTKVTFA
jgi:hypothetical protein